MRPGSLALPRGRLSILRSTSRRPIDERRCRRTESPSCPRAKRGAPPARSRARSDRLPICFRCPARRRGDAQRRRRRLGGRGSARGSSVRASPSTARRRCRRARSGGPLGPGDLVAYLLRFPRRPRGSSSFGTLAVDDRLAATLPGVPPRIQLLLELRTHVLENGGECQGRPPPWIELDPATGKPLAKLNIPEDAV